MFYIGVFSVLPFYLQAHSELIHSLQNKLPWRGSSEQGCVSWRGSSRTGLCRQPPLGHTKLWAFAQPSSDLPARLHLWGGQVWRSTVGQLWRLHLSCAAKRTDRTRNQLLPTSASLLEHSCCLWRGLVLRPLRLRHNYFTNYQGTKNQLDHLGLKLNKKERNTGKRKPEF